MRKFTKKITAYIMLLTMFISMLSGCGKKETSSVGEEVGSYIEELLNSTLAPTEQPKATEAAIPTTSPLVTGAGELNSQEASAEFEEEYYEETTEDKVFSFVCELLENELGLFYEVFTGYVTLPDGEEIYGITFADYGETYTLADSERQYYPCGFIPFYEDGGITEDAIATGLEITALQESNQDYGYFYAYQKEAFRSHFVLYDQYVVYGVNEAGELICSLTDFSREVCDETLGTLYSYDENKYLIEDYENAEYVRVTGTSLSEMINYAALEAEINRIIKEQDYNFSQVELETSITIAKEAMNNYLLSMQEESFLGYSVAELVELSQQINPVDGIQITPDGLQYIELSATLPEDPAEFAQWLNNLTVGIALMMEGFFANFTLPISARVGEGVKVCSVNPISAGISTGLLSSGALKEGAIGAIVEAVLYIMTTGDLEGVDWNRLLITAAAGAIAGVLVFCLCPVGNVVLSAVIEGTLEAAVAATNVYLDGASFGEVAGTFLLSAISGIVMNLLMNDLFEYIGKKALPVVKNVIKNSDGVVAKFFKETVPDVGKNFKNFAERLAIRTGLKKYTKEILAKLKLPQGISKELMEHICIGRRKGNKTVSGVHTLCFSDCIGKAIKETKSTINDYGVYDVVIEGKGFSTCFPVDMTPQDIANALGEAVEKAKQEAMEKAQRYFATHPDATKYYVKGTGNVKSGKKSGMKLEFGIQIRCKDGIIQEIADSDIKTAHPSKRK